MKTVLFLGMVVIVAAGLALAGAPNVINYQGRVTTPAGTAIPNGNYLVRFVIYNAPSGGTVLWDNDFRTVTINNGLLNYALGDSVQLPNTLFAGDTTRYLGIRVGADPELTPRVKLVSVPYARQSLRADTAQVALSVSGGGGGWTDGGPAVHLTTLSDKVAIGTNGANNKLDVTMTEATNGAGYFHIDNASNPTPALYGSTDGTGHGIWGDASNPNAAGIYGTSSSGYGVQGTSASGYGVYGQSSSKAGVLGSGNWGVLGEHPTSHNYGYLGSTDYGVYGKDTSSSCFGALGAEAAGAVGVGQEANEVGIYGEGYYGVGIRASSADSTAIHASSAFGLGVYGTGRRGVFGKGSTYGMRGEHYSAGNYATLGEESRAIYASAIGMSDDGLVIDNDSAGIHLFAATRDYGLSVRADTGDMGPSLCSGALASHGWGVVGSGDSSGVFGGIVRINRSSTHPGGLVLHTNTHNDPGRCGIFFSNNQLGTFEGDDTEDQVFGFYSGFTGSRKYDARLAVYGSNTSGWGNCIQLYHDGTDGFVATDVGDVSIMPALNVGVGTSTPGYKLDVAGSCHATSFPTSSDERLKENVQPIEDALAKIAQISGVSFDWNGTYAALGRSSGHREIGVIAQDVEKVLPELVTTWGDEDYRAVDYGRLTAVLVEATKQLAAENTELKAQNAEILRQLEKLQQAVENLRKGR